MTLPFQLDVDLATVQPIDWQLWNFNTVVSVTITFRITFVVYVISSEEKGNDSIPVRRAQYCLFTSRCDEMRPHFAIGMVLDTFFSITAHDLVACIYAQQRFGFPRY